MIYIDKVHYEYSSYSAYVENSKFISEVKWTDSLYESAYKRCSKDEMINFINQHPRQVRTKYNRHGYWLDGEEVHVVGNRYLRTDANQILCDNLENLPEY